MAKSNVVVMVTGQDNTGAVFDAVAKHLEDIKNRTAETDSVLAKFGERFTRALEFTGIYFGIREVVDGLKEMVKGAVETGVEIGHLAQQTGISSENLSVLKYAAQETGVEFETLTKGFKKLSTELYDYEHGSKQAKQAFDALGISEKDLTATHGDMYAVLELVASKMQALPDGFEKSAAASQLFGRSGQLLIPILNQGGAGIERFRSEAEDLGLVLDSKTIEQMEELHKVAEGMEGAFQGLALEITSALAPALERMAKDATELVKAMRVSPVDAVKLMESNLISNIPMFGPAAAALKARGDQLRKEALGDIGQSVATKSSSDLADSAAHTGKGTGDLSFGDPEAAKKLQSARDKAAETLRQAQGRTVDTSGYEHDFELMQNMNREASEAADRFAEDFIKNKQEESKASIEANKREIDSLKEVQESRIRIAGENYSATVQNADFELETGRITASERVAIIRQAAQQEYQTKLNALSNIAALDSIDPNNPQKLQADLDQSAELQARHSQQMVEIDQQEVERRREIMSGYMHDIFDPLIDKPKSAADAFKQMADNILRDLERIEENKLIENLMGMMDGKGTSKIGGVPGLGNAPGGTSANGGSSHPWSEALGLPSSGSSSKRSGIGIGGLLGGLLGKFSKHKSDDDSSDSDSSNGGWATSAGTLSDAITSQLKQGKGGSGPGVTVNIINQGSPKEASSSGTTGDGMYGMVTNVIMKDAETGGPLTKALGGSFRQFFGGGDSDDN